MDYEKKHKEEVARATQLWECGDITRENLEYIFPELVESKDERIRKALIRYHQSTINIDGIKGEEILAWLEKQYKKPQGKSALEAVNEEKVDNQNYVKPADNVEPRFKVGHWIIFNEHHNSVYQVEKIQGLQYYLRHYNGGSMSVRIDSPLIRQWTIADKKNGDVLACDSKYGQEIGIVKKYIWKYGGCDKCFETYCFVDWDGIFRVGEYMGSQNIHPATKEQRDLLFAKMKEAGYKWDEDKKELKKIEEEYDGEDYGIDSLFHAQRILEKTLGKVEGYQTDDGILSHKCAISAVKKLYEQKSAEWNEEDETILNDLIDYFEVNDVLQHSEKQVVYWLKSLKERIGE